jgi:hypothetical protein
MEVKFNKNEQQVAAEKATAPAPTSVPAVQNKNSALGPTGLILGDRIPEFDEIILPRLNIVQNIGELRNSFDVGSLVFNQTVALYTPGKINEKTKVVEREATPPIILTVLGFKPTRFCEKCEGGVRGMIVNTEHQVRAAGGTLDYAEWKLKKESGMKRFEQMADALVAIERPDRMPDDETTFVYPVEKTKVALALWAMRGTSYTAAAKRVFFTQRAVGCLRGGYPTWAYAVSTREETYPGGNKAWIPICLPVRKNTDKFLDFVRSVLTAPQSEAEPS